MLAGYGTVGLEILTQVHNVDAVLCPVGSGGLIASILLAIKTLKPSCLIYVSILLTTHIFLFIIFFVIL